LGLSKKVANSICKSNKVTVAILKGLREIFHHLPISQSKPLAAIEKENIPFMRRYFKFAPHVKDLKANKMFFEHLNGTLMPGSGSIYHILFKKYFPERKPKPTKGELRAESIRLQDERIAALSAKREAEELRARELAATLSAKREQSSKLAVQSESFKLAALARLEECPPLEDPERRALKAPLGYNERKTLLNLKRVVEYPWLSDTAKQYIITCVQTYNRANVYVNHSFYDCIPIATSQMPVGGGTKQPLNAEFKEFFDKRLLRSITVVPD
jgi:hypothetical protein